MNIDEIIDVFEQYKNNPNIINNNDYFNRLLGVIRFFQKITNETFEILSKEEQEKLNEYITNNENFIINIFKNSRLINYAFNDPEFMNYLSNYLDSNELLSNYPQQLLDYISKNKDIGSLAKNKEIFNYVTAVDKSLVFKFDLDSIFSTIDSEILQNYGNYILEYIEKNEIPSYSTFNRVGNYELVDYIIKNDKKLLSKLDLERIAIILTKELINNIGEELIEYIKRQNELSSGWSDNKDLFDYVAKHDSSLISLFDIKSIFPELTEEIINTYGEGIIEYIKKTEYISSWKDNADLFLYVALHEPTLLSKFDFSKIIDDILKESAKLEKYSEGIMIYLKNNKFPYGLDKNVELFNYIKNIDFDLASRFNLNEIFYYASEDTLLKNKDLLIKYVLNNDSIGHKLSQNKMLFQWILEYDESLMTKFDLQFFFPNITTDLLSKYGKYFIQYIKNGYYLNYSWKTNKYLFDYIVKNDESLISKFYLIFLWPEITDEIIEKYGKYILDYIRYSDNIYIWDSNKCEKLYAYVLKNDVDLIKKINVGNYFNKDEYLEILSSKYGIDKKILTYKLQYLYSRNDEIFKTLDFRILKIDEIEMKTLSKITLYPDLQEKILNLNGNTLQVFSKIINACDSEKFDLSAVLETTLININKYNDLLSNISVNDLSAEKINNLLLLLQKEKNIFQIQNVEDLTDENFSKKKNDYFKNIQEKLDSLSLEELKEAIFEKKYAIDIQMANFINNRYYHNFDELSESGLDVRIIKIIKEIYYILNETDVDNLKEIFSKSKIIETDYHTMLAFESSIRKEYAKMYSDSLYKINEENKSMRPILQNVKFDGKNIEFYELDDDFNMQIHALGAYRKWERPANFLEDWNRPKIAYHGICTSYIGNNQIATARPKGPILGFSGYDESALLLAGNFDLFSDDAIQSFSTSLHTPYSMLPPKTMIDSTRHNHNEMVLERINKNTTISYKRKPNYIVYIVDDASKLSNFDINNEKYNQTLQAAADFDIPIVIIDRLKYAKREKAKCDKLEKEFYETKDIKKLEKLFLGYMNNGVGCRIFEEYDANGSIIQKGPEEYQKIFSEEVIREFYQRISSYIQHDVYNIDINGELSHDDILQIGNEIVSLIKLLQHEKESYAVSHKSYTLSPPINLDVEIDNLKQIYDEYKNKIKNLKSIDNTEHKIM